jgi:hypothetical protein
MLQTYVDGIKYGSAIDLHYNRMQGYNLHITKLSITKYKFGSENSSAPNIMLILPGCHHDLESMLNSRSPLPTIIFIIALSLNIMKSVLCVPTRF